MKPLLIGGRRVATAGWAPNVNPSDLSGVVDRHAQGEAGHVAMAVDAAREAFEAWSREVPARRGEVLSGVAAELEARRAELGRLLAREEGKPLADAEAEVVRAAQILHFFAGEAVRLSGEALPGARANTWVETSREPLGVVGAITSWNFPVAITPWKTAPALAFGDTVVLKPAELAPGSAWALCDALERAGLPPGALSLVTGPGAAVGQAILDHPGVDAVTFTGGEATGRRVAEACARRMRRGQLEMGGKNPLVVLDDADLDRAVRCAVDGAFGQAGQRCTASSRLIVTEGVHTRFVEACVERLRDWHVDDAPAPGAEMGPVASEGQLRRTLGWVERARREGASLRWGGEPLRRGAQGFYVAPALLTDTTPDMAVNREEVFGPVASVIRLRDACEALAVATDTPYGLCAGVCTTSLAHAQRFERELRAGIIVVNLPTAGVDFHVPFGGRKASSLGPREQGGHAREFFTVVKTAYTAA